MATRSRIGLLIGDESVVSVYHHWDGYPEWLGVYLRQNYTTKRRIRDMREYNFSVAEVYCVPTPLKPWPQLGFQLAAVHTQRGYKGDVKLSYSTML